MTEEELDRKLAGYRVPEASRDLADRVMTRIAEPRRLLWRTALVAAAAVAVVAITAVFVFRSPAAPTEGSFASAGRASLSIGSRAVAVAEDNADVRWSVAGDGATRVEQRAGNVFYRVDHGAAFSVETPAGTVNVRGTCFRVEVFPMPITRQHVISATLGAVAAATVAIVVYEGGVRVVNARGTVDLDAGERGQVTTGEAPTRDGNTVAIRDRIARAGANATHAQLAAETVELRDKLEAAQNTIVTLKKQIDERTQERPKFVHPSKEQLLAWAEKCFIHVDSPNLFGATPPQLDKRDIQEWGLTKTEQPAMEKILSEMHGKTRDEMREIYILATNNVAGADELTPNAMLSEISDKATPGDKLRTRQRISRERAGLQAPPPVTDMSPFERATRLVMRLGDDYERLLGNAIGDARARDLRERFNSWPGLQMSEEGCEETTR